MTEPQLIQGRWFTEEDLALLESWRQEHPEWSRYRLSRELAARHFLHKLDQRGLFTRPAPNPKGGRQAAQWPAPPSPPSQLIEQPLSQLQPLSLDWVGPRSPVARELAATLAQYHYLGWRGPVGPHLAYRIHDRHDRLLAVLV